MPTSSSTQRFSSPAGRSANGEAPPTIPTIVPSLLVSLVAPPWLLTIVAVQATQQLLEQLGLASEEIFRGDRLPVLHFPEDRE